MKFNLATLAWRNIRSRRARSWLTILGVLIGVMAVVALISIATGVENAVLKQYKDIGYDVILLTPRTAATAFGMAGGNFTGAQGGARSTAQGAATGQAGRSTAATQNKEFDPDLLRQDVSAIIDVGQIGTRVLSVATADLSGFVRVSAPSQGLISGFASLLGGFKVAQGHGLDTASANQVVLGARTATTMGVGVGQSITIGDLPFTVAGILAPSKGSRGAAGLSSAATQAQAGALGGNLGGGGAEVIRSLTNTDDAVFMPYEQARIMWAGDPMSTMVAVRIKQGISVTDTITKINAALTEQGVSMTTVSTQAIADQVQRTLGMVKTVLASIAAIALVVGAVGMMNTMYTSVLERTREIGILKSIGAKDRQVLGLFLIDSGMMGLIGGILGLVIGTGLSFLGTSVLGRLMGVTSFSPSFTPGLIVGVVGFSFVLGALAGAWPAWHAARLDPVEALAAE
jgi:putative ABC transport system permease protein